MSIRRRLFLAFSVILVLFGLNIFIYRQSNAQRGESFEAVNRAVDRQILLGDIERALEERRQTHQGIQVLAKFDSTFKPEQIDELITQLDEIDGQITQLLELNNEADPQIEAFSLRYGQLRDRWVQFYRGLSVPPAGGEEGAEAEAAATEDETAEPAEEAVDLDALAGIAVEQLAALEESGRQRVAEATGTFNEVSANTDRIMLWIFALSIMVALGIALWLSAYLSRGLQTLESGAQRIGKGDLDHRIEVTGRDELAGLATAFNRMSENLLAARERVEEARASAEHANQAKSTFLANMSHELRTPMNAIIGYTEMLTEDAEDLGQDEFIPDLKKILAAGKHLLALINDVLDLSKIEAGKMTLFLEEFSVESLVDDVTTTIKPLVDKNSNQMQIDVAADAGTIKADETKVRQTLFNLLSNASKFTNQGTVTLAARRFARDGSDWLELKVADTGIGMSREQMAKVFDEFTQADSSTTRKFGGTGLGLTISKKFCQLMGGDVNVKSAEGAGTTFTVELPAVVGEESTPEPVAPGPRSPSGEAGTAKSAQTVLVIDDDQTTLDLTRRYLTREGFAVRTATSGIEGLAVAKNERPAAITLDVMMPGMDGWAVLTELKRDPQTADIPVIMLTMLDQKEMGFALGASEYMSKPIDRKRLSTHLERYLSSSRAGGGQILIVEDEAETRELLRRGLEKNGWTIAEADNGLVALSRLAEHSPDLILLDLAMPQMDGFAFLERLRASDEWHHIPVVVVTARDLTPEEQARLDGQVEAVLKKGAHPRDSLLSELRDRVTDCVDRGGTSRNAG